MGSKYSSRFLGCSLAALLFICLIDMQRGAFSQEGKIKHRVYLTANTVDLEAGSKFYTALRELLTVNQEAYSFIINGDLVSQQLTRDAVSSDSVKIKKLLETASGFENGRVIIIPGDRDWADSGPEGWKSVKKLEKLVKSFNFKNVKWAIKDGCPGPKSIELDDDILLVTIDTQWWNHPYDKPGASDADCKISNTKDFQEEVEDVLDENVDKNVLIAGHFPIFSLGEYGGHLPLKKHIFPLTDLSKALYVPLPIFGSLYPSYRENVGTAKDIHNENFEPIRDLLEDIIFNRSTLIYLSGHEQNLQILRHEDEYFINSGSPAKATYAAHGGEALFSKALPGLIEIVYYESGRVDAIVLRYSEEKGFDPHAQFALYRSTCEAANGHVSDDKVPRNNSYVPCKPDPEALAKMSGKYDTLATVVAGPEYAAGGLKRVFFGAHYRDTWTAPVRVPYLDLDTTFGGLTPDKKGGGRQTKSLKFKAGNGMHYVFRSVDKDPAKALAYDYRATLAAVIVRDQTSTQHPYAAMAAEVMLNELGLLHAHPNLYLLPNDGKLGSFRESYGNLLGMLEELPSSSKKGEKVFAGADEILRSHELFAELYQDHNFQIDANEFAVARAFDILVGDWGRHEDNYKWAAYKNGDKTIFRPIPRDRDHVFSRWDGLLPWLADREWMKASGENFGHQISGVRSLMFQGRHLDRYAGSKLTKEDWINAAKIVQEKMTDEVIAHAISNMPKENDEHTNKTLEEKLRSRRRDLPRGILQYYHDMLAKDVDVVGSNKREYFAVSRNTDGTVDVAMYDADKAQQKSSELLYSRKFHPNETKEIRLFGMGGKDVFDINGETKRSIKIRVIGGPGADVIKDRSKVGGSGKKTLVYEHSEKGEIELGDAAKRAYSVNESAYDYERTAYAYNSYLPLPYIAYNADDGFLASLGIQFTTQKYGKQPYSTKHGLRAVAATSGTYSVGYGARFHQVYHNWDVVVIGYLARPDHFTNFYGLGNETVKDDSLLAKDFYKTRYDANQVTAGVTHDFWKKSNFDVMLRYAHNESQIDPSSTIFAGENFFGTDQISLVEARFRLDLDFRNNTGLPTRGMRLLLSHNNGIIINNDNSNYGQTLGILEAFSSKHILLPWTLGLRAGGGDSYGDIPFYNQFSLGQNNYLRGFRSNRYTGRALLFLSSELRLQLFDSQTQVIPIRLGLKGFYDIGRVYVNGENSDKWHSGYGFGFYLVPLRENFTMDFSFGFSEEESLLFRFGIGRAF